MKKSLFVILGLILILSISSFLNVDNSSKVPPTKIMTSEVDASTQTKKEPTTPITSQSEVLLPEYKIVGVKILRKGGQIEPLIEPKYTLAVVTAALLENDSIVENDVESMLLRIIGDIRKQQDPDAISVELYLSQNHINSSSYFASGDWWPKGHSFSPSNEVNIVNKKIPMKLQLK